MHAPTFAATEIDIRQPHRHQHGILRDFHAHLRGWSRPENLVATFSLGVIVTAILTLLYQSMAI